MDAPAHAVQRLKSDPHKGRDVWLIQAPGESPCVLRRQRASRFMRLRFMLRLSPAHRAVRAARLLTKHSIRCAQPHSEPQLVQHDGSTFIESLWSYTPGNDLWHHWQHHLQFQPRDEQLAMARAVGHLVAKMIGAHLDHRDLKLSNIVLNSASASGIDLVIVDPDGTHRNGWIGESAGGMLYCLGVQFRTNGFVIPRMLFMAATRAALRGVPNGARGEALSVLQKHLRR